MSDQNFTDLYHMILEREMAKYWEKEAKLEKLMWERLLDPQGEYLSETYVIEQINTMLLAPGLVIYGSGTSTEPDSSKSGGKRRKKSKQSASRLNVNDKSKRTSKIPKD